MDDLEARQRAAVVKEASSWIGTPYHHAGRVKGAGVDCAMHLLESFAGAGMIESFDYGYYPPDWHLHRSGEKYLGTVLGFASEISGPPLPADVVVFKFGRCFAHGGIVIKWPQIVHAYLNCSVTVDDVNRDQRLITMGEAQNRPRPRRFFTLWPDGGLKNAPLQRRPNEPGRAF